MENDPPVVDDTRPPEHRRRLLSSLGRALPRLPRVLLNLLLVALILGLLAACYAPVYFGSSGHAERRGR